MLCVAQPNNLVKVVVIVEPCTASTRLWLE